jgi:hypothetical protein
MYVIIWGEGGFVVPERLRSTAEHSDTLAVSVYSAQARFNGRNRAVPMKLHLRINRI